MILQLVCALLVPGIALCLYESIRSADELVARIYLIARVAEGVLLAASIAVLAAMPNFHVWSYEASANADLPDFAHRLLLDLSDGLFQVGMIALGLGSVILCLTLIRRGMVPIWIGGLGIVGYALLITSGVAELSGGKAPEILFGPGALFEIVFPIWLIARGLSTPTQNQLAG